MLTENLKKEANKGNLLWQKNHILPVFPQPAEVMEYIDATVFSFDYRVMLASLQGIVNSNKPRIFTFDGIQGGKYAWLKELEIKYEEKYDLFELVKKYASELNGIIVYDPGIIDTVNLASTIAGVERALVASPTVLTKLKENGIQLEIIEDLRGKFADKKGIDVYRYLYENYWDKVNHNVLVSFYPDWPGHIREYGIAVNAAIIWLDSREADESELLDKFLSGMNPANSVVFGWWKDEGAGVSSGSKYGVGTVASDWSSNLSYYSSQQEIVVPEPPAKPELKNKLYAAIIFSDGDNLQYMQGAIKYRWDNADRGKFPVSWTIPPIIGEASPGMMNWYLKTATPNDCFVAGPSGLAYMYPLNWPNKETLKEFFKRTDEYCTRIGVRTATVWNDGDFFNKPPFDEELVDIITNNLGNMLGVTQQVKTDNLIKNDVVIASLDVPYSWNDQTNIMEEKITKAYEDFTNSGKQKPAFVAVQANAGQHTPAALKEMVDKILSLGDDIEFVRLDHYFMLLRESFGYPPERVKK